MKKLTSFMLLLLCAITTSWANLVQPYYKNCDFWSPVSSCPEGITTVADASGVKKDGAVIQWVSNSVTVTADGNVVVTFAHNGGDHMLNMLGVDLVDAQGNVVAKDYHYGSAGTNPSNAVYTMESLTAGAQLTLRCFVYDNTNNNDRTNSAQGSYTVTNVTGEVLPCIKPAVDLANGVYVIRNAGNNDMARYDGTDIARGVFVADATDENHTFAITKGDNGYYTIQAVDGKYVIYTNTSGTSIAFAEGDEATDANKWWSIRKGNSDNRRIIIPSTNDVYNAEGWNYSKTVGGVANRAVGLWGSNDGNSQWYITVAPNVFIGRVAIKIAGSYASVAGSNIAKSNVNNNIISGFTITRGENGCCTIQTTDGKFLTYSSTNNHLLETKDATGATDDNKWWVITYDLNNVDGRLDILPKQNGIVTTTPAFNWAQEYNKKGVNTGLGLWTAEGDNSYCELEKFVDVEAGLYFIQATGTGNDANWYMSYENNNDWKAMSLANGENLGAKYVWNFEVCEDGFKLKSSNLNKYAKLGDASALSSGPSHFETEFTPASKFVFERKSPDTFIVKDGANNVVRTEGNGAVNYWSGEANETWKLIPVTEIEVSVNEFASICLPFAVEVENATAYAIENIGTEYVSLVEKADIPAGEGAILAGNGTAKLVVADEATSDWTNNKLEGTTIDSYIAGPAYVLGNLDGIGLYIAELNKNANGAEGSSHFKNNANKAYLPMPATANLSNSLRFDFGGTTAIEEVEAESENTDVIYDLQGRRVNEITETGIYIVNGNKVLVK